MEKTSRFAPLSTYRLQFNQDFTFQQAKELIEYLNDLGITHCYSSPLLKAKATSSHGYDIINHSEFNPEIGTRKEFESFVEALRGKKMGLICDIVPNHMYIVDPSNKWWYDILENGPSSQYADYFDIDWHPPRRELINKVLLPLLDQQYGEALENQILKIAFQDNAFRLQLPFAYLPTDPKSWNIILEPIAQQVATNLQEDNQIVLELKSIITALTHLPLSTDPDPEKKEERNREKEVIKRRLGTLFAQNALLMPLVLKQLDVMNGTKGDPRSFDLLEEFLEKQSYRLCFWRVANDEINFRRFFDVFELGGLRTEKPEVFTMIHSLIFEYISKGCIDGLRIDHIDGLWDPEQYLINLQSHCRQLAQEALPHENNLFFVVAEKILIGNEKLRPEWPLNGTVGYDFLNQLNGIFILQQNKKPLNNIYLNFTGINVTPFDLVYESKKFILLVSMSSELYILARHLDRISEQHRSSRDFTAESLRYALSDVVACFPVYRSYIRAQQEKISEEDRHYIITAIARAKRRNPAIYMSIFDFIQGLLLLEFPPGLTENEIQERKNFVMRFQQFTGPVTAKGIEDTAFYRYFPLSSLNEVGADPYGFGLSLETFHKKNADRAESWPQTMTATSTHDTKRSEDVRARINVLSEITDDWEIALLRWRKLNLPLKEKDGEDSIPDPNDEYLLYQTLIGTWPLYPMDPQTHLQYMKRIQIYMEKATKEAKIHTSWINPNKEYDKGMHQFVQKILSLDEADNLFLSDFKNFNRKIISAGMLNSLSQVVIKLTSPGIPDIYQGNEAWDFSLVDPDNRKAIDYTNLKYLLQTIKEKTGVANREILAQLMRNPEDGRIKLYITRELLLLRRRLPELFREGDYRGLNAKGERQNHIIAFVRSYQGQYVISVVGRFFSSLLQNDKCHIDSKVWQGTVLALPDELANKTIRHVLTGENIKLEAGVLNLEQLFKHLPHAVLEIV